jgi:hypothetical protein
MAMAPPTKAVPRGRLKEAFDIMELPKKAPAAMLEQDGLRSGNDDKRAAHKSCVPHRPAAKPIA